MNAYGDILTFFNTYLLKKMSLNGDLNQHLPGTVESKLK